MLARLVKYVQEAYSEELTIDSVQIWSDNQIALSWVFSDRSLPIYVRNRVDEIHSLLPSAVYHYISTKENPSDLFTRGVSASLLRRSDLWWSGPAWLSNQLDWPPPWVAGGGEALPSETVAVTPLPQELPTFM